MNMTMTLRAGAVLDRSPFDCELPPAVSAIEVARRYGRDDSAVDALAGVSIELPVGQFTAVELDVVDAVSTSPAPAGGSSAHDAHAKGHRDQARKRARPLRRCPIANSERTPSHEPRELRHRDEFLSQRES